MHLIFKIINNPVSWLLITILMYKSSEHLKQYKFFSKVPPTCLAAFIIILMMKIFSENYAGYNKGGCFISYLLGPATIAFALPLIKNLDVLKQNWKVISIGVLVATFTGILSVFFIAGILKATNPIILSLIPKAVTTPIAIEISKSIGGIPALTSCFVIITGVIGALLGHRLLKIVKVKNNIAIGLAIGASSHVIGTSACLEKNEVQAAISSLALILVGILTSILAPIIMKIFI